MKSDVVTKEPKDNLAATIEIGEKLNKDLVEKKAAEAKEAELSGLSPEDRKAAEQKAADDKAAADKQAETDKQKAAEEADKALLTAKDEDLDSAQKARKSELVKQEKETNAEKRINELIGKLKAAEAKIDAQSAEGQKRIAALETELAGLRDTVKAPVVQADARKREEERIAKRIEEDKALPRERRREMTKAELDEWFVEDPTSAQEFIADRALRRKEEREADLNQDGAKAEAEKVLKAQQASGERVRAKHPELDFIKFGARVKELKAEGKTKDEMSAILKKENPKAFLASQIIFENPDRFQYSPNAPELLAAEVEKRMKTKPEDEGDKEDREEQIRREAAEAERQRREAADAASSPESRRGGGGIKLEGEEKEAFEVYKKQFPHKTYEDFTKNKARRRA